MWYDRLTTQEKSLVEQQVTNNQKSYVVAYFFLLLLGHIGAHRFYIKGLNIAGFVQAFLGIVGWLLSGILIGYVLLVPLWIWLFIDFFTIPRMIRKESDKLREQFAEEIVTSNQY